MTVMELKKLPLGFRFHPTDEELVRHYLKGKITGHINSEVEVIPEIDVCKCEPWDLPDKSLIRSDDPEWFFFAPKDRKYPNGSRSNRATEAGYWKATGKDRVIKSKGDKRKQHVIGMKKTLVFHRGRAPKGERTGWIMHEYRTTEPEFDSGEQGGYVLYRLFRKQEEKPERPSAEEMDRSGYSPTPSRSSPDNIEANEEANTPLNKESPESGLHESPMELPNPVENHAMPMTRWLADRTDNLVAAPANVPHVPPYGHVDVVPKVDPSAQLVNSQNMGGDGTCFLPDFPLDIPHGDPFSTDSQKGPLGPDALDAFLIQTLADPDEHSSTTSKVQYDSDNGILPHELENPGIMQAEFQDDQSWWQDLDFLPDGPNPQLSGLYENTPLLPYDSTDQDVLSMDSGAESLHDLFNSMEEGTGISFMPRQLHPQSGVQPSYLFSNQGTAARRLRLQMPANIEYGETITREESEGEVSCVVTPKYLSETVEESTADKDVASDGDEAESTGIVIRSVAQRYLSEAVEESSADKDVDSDGDEAESTGIVIRSRRPALNPSSESSFTQQGTATQRLRLQAELNTGSCSQIDDSSSFITEETKTQHKVENSEIEEDASTNVAGSVDDASSSCHGDEHQNIPELDAETAVPDAKSGLRLRKPSEKSDKDIKQDSIQESLVRAPRQKGGFQSYIVWLVLSVAVLLLLCVGVYGWV